MYELYCKTGDNIPWDLVAVFDVQKDAIKKIIELSNEVDNVELVIMNSKTGEIGINIKDGKLIFVNKIDF